MVHTFSSYVYNFVETILYDLIYIRDVLNQIATISNYYFSAPYFFALYAE